VSDASEGYLAGLRKALELAYRAFRYGAVTDKAAAGFAPGALAFCVIEMCIFAGIMLTR
jgi:hypothetical protein